MACQLYCNRIEMHYNSGFTPSIHLIVILINLPELLISLTYRICAMMSLSKVHLGKH